MKRPLILIPVLSALLGGGLSSCELESGDCTDADDVSVTFAITAKLVDQLGVPVSGAPGYIRTYKDVCDGTRKSVSPLKTTTGPTGLLSVTHGYNLRNEEDRVTIEAGFDDDTPHTPAVKTYSYSDLKTKDGLTIDVRLPEVKGTLPTP